MGKQEDGGHEKVMGKEVFTYAGISLVSWLANETKIQSVVEDREKERKEEGRKTVTTYHVLQRDSPTLEVEGC